MFVIYLTGFQWNLENLCNFRSLFTALMYLAYTSEAITYPSQITYLILLIKTYFDTWCRTWNIKLMFTYLGGGEKLLM